MLDTEVDRGLRSDIQDTLTSMLQTLAPEVLSHWLSLCKSVLSAAKSNEQQKPEKGKKKENFLQVIYFDTYNISDWHPV